MPTYQYQCTECGEGLEAVQKFTDDSLTDCPSCNGRLKKVFSAVGIVFKGSGFYRNDSRGTSSSSTSSSSAASSSDSGSGSSSSTSGDSAGGSAASKSSESKSADSGGSKSAKAASSA